MGINDPDSSFVAQETLVLSDTVAVMRQPQETPVVLSGSLPVTSPGWGAVQPQCRYPPAGGWEA